MSPTKPSQPSEQPPSGPDDVARLEAVRDRLEAALSDPGTTPRDLATVSREYRLTLAALAEQAPSAKASPLDEIAAKRTKRKGA